MGIIMGSLIIFLFLFLILLLPAGFGLFHWLLLVICGWANASDAMEILCVSFLLPTARCDLLLSTSDMGLLTASIFLGESKLLTPTVIMSDLWLCFDLYIKTCQSFFFLSRYKVFFLSHSINLMSVFGCLFDSRAN